MQEEFNQFKMNNAWYLIERLKDKNVIGIKWVFKNKLDKYDTIMRNKERLVVK